MASGVLYCYPESFRAAKVLIAAQYSGANVKVAENFKLGETNLSSEFLKKFPVGKVPAFESSEGDCIAESNAIANFVGNDQLNGADAVTRANILQWINYADSEILPASCTWVFPCMGIMQYNKQNTERAKEEVKKALAVLNKHLSTCTFLVGERITLADISVVCNMLGLYKMVLEPKFRADFGNVTRWFVTCANQPQFIAVLGKFELCEKMAQFDAKKYQELQGKGESKGAKGGKKEEKVTKKQPAKQEAKPKETVEAEPPAPKAPKDPLAVLPTGSFNMDEFKRTFSNEKISVALSYLWENFDSENYSMWVCEYADKEELKKNRAFMTSNLMRGFFQRVDGMRKTAFGTLLVTGENYDNTLEGFWMWRGQELAFKLSEDWQVDYESFNWRKLDPANEEDRKIATKYLSQEGFDKEVYSDQTLK